MNQSPDRDPFSRPPEMFHDDRFQPTPARDAEPLADAMLTAMATWVLLLAMAVLGIYVYVASFPEAWTVIFYIFAMDVLLLACCLRWSLSRLRRVYPLAFRMAWTHFGAFNLAFLPFFILLLFAHEMTGGMAGEHTFNDLLFDIQLVFYFIFLICLFIAAISFTLNFFLKMKRRPKY